jgi:hypothetical protein
MVVDSFRSATVSLEPYVDSIVAGKFLGLHPVTVMRRTYIGALPGDYRGRSDLSFVPFLPPGLPMPGRTKETDMMLNETKAV